MSEKLASIKIFVFLRDLVFYKDIELIINNIQEYFIKYLVKYIIEKDQEYIEKLD